MPSEHRRTAVLVVATVVGCLLVVAGLYALGSARPPTPPAVATDRLGPEAGADIAAYLRTSASATAVATGPRWALISLRAPVDDSTAWRLTDGTSRSQVALHVTVPGVATPTTVVPLTDDRASLETARTRAVIDVAGTTTSAGTAIAGDAALNRTRRVTDLTVGRLRAGCACVVGMVVRADAGRLRAIAAIGDVRGLQVLPADAAGGRFAVSVLLPEQMGRVGPPRDEAPVPTA